MRRWQTEHNNSTDATVVRSRLLLLLLRTSVAEEENRATEQVLTADPTVGRSRTCASPGERDPSRFPPTPTLPCRKGRKITSTRLAQGIGSVLPLQVVGLGVFHNTPLLHTTGEVQTVFTVCVATRKAMDTAMQRRAHPDRTRYYFFATYHRMKKHLRTTIGIDVRVADFEWMDRTQLCTVNGKRPQYCVTPRIAREKEREKRTRSKMVGS